MQLHRSFIDIGFAESEEVGFFKLAIDLEAEASGFLDGLGGVQGDDAEEFVDAGGIDL